LSTIYFLDASLYVFRAYHGRGAEWHDQDGWPTHAVHGFTQTLIALLEQTKTTAIAVCFDEGFGSNFRHAIDPQYKANREPPTEDLVRQFGYCKEVATALGCVALADTRYEADDLIGALSSKCSALQQQAVIVSADKDLAQLLNDYVRQWDFGKGEVFGAAAVIEKHGVRPDQMAQMQALSGDAVDNIPGIPGVGAKTAAELIRHFGDLDSVLSRWAEVEFLRIRGGRTLAYKLRDHAEDARRSHRLTQIALDAPTPALAELKRKPVDTARIDALFDQLGFGAYLRGRAKRLKPV
jgi:DNA polymerase I